MLYLKSANTQVSSVIPEVSKYTGEQQLRVGPLLWHVCVVQRMHTACVLCLFSMTYLVYRACVYFIWVK